MAFIHTDAGATFIRSRAVEGLNHRIAGRVAVGTLRVQGSRIVLRDLRLYPPRGDLVARVDQIGIAFRLLPLLHKRLELPELDLRRPLLRLAPAWNGGGPDLPRALASRGSRQAQPPRRPGGWSIRVQVNHLGLTGGAILYWRKPLPAGGEPPAVGLRGWRVSGSDLSNRDIRKLHTYEQRHKHRKTLMSELEQRLA